MLIKRIIKESLLNEVGTATAKPYKWRLKELNADSALYRFKTTGGSNLVIEVNFLLLHPFQFENMGVLDKIEHPYYYWDTEFLVVKHKDEEFWGDERSMTISKSPYKSERTEIFRIMSTLSEIVRDLISIRKVRGFAFKPASDSRGKLFIKYFESQFPESDIMRFEEGATVITINDSLKYTEGGDPIYDESIYNFEEPTFKEKIKTKLSGGSSDEWDYNYETGEWERNDLLSKTRRKLGVK